MLKLDNRYGDHLALLRYADKAADGKLGQFRQKEAFRIHEALALSNSPAAQRQLAWHYDTGSGTRKNAKKAFHWYKVAANAGDAYAQHCLAHFYWEGIVVNRNNRQAFRWAMEAAKQGEPGACTNVGHCLRTGHGVAKNMRQGLRWYKKAARKGNDTALYNLGYASLFGLGTKKSIPRAISYFRKAARYNREDAFYYLAEIYFGLHGGKNKNFRKGTFYARKASKLGSPSADTLLAQSPNPQKFMLPKEIENKKDACGPVSAWYIMASFGISANGREILKECFYDPKGGAKIIDIAKYFARRGFRSSYYTDFNLDPNWPYIKEAKSLGISIKDAIPLNAVLKMLHRGAKCIVLYKNKDGRHFSPLLGVKNKKVGLPLEINQGLPISEFLKRWKTTNRACLVFEEI